MRPLSLSISQSFRCFDEVARKGSLRKAAESLNLTAAAVHQQILNLEEQIGTPLFDRLPQGMKLSSAGEIMVASVRRSQRDFEDAAAQVEALRTMRRGHISLAVSHSSAEHLIPHVIETAMRKYPGLTYNVRSGSGEAIMKWVSSGESDFGLCLRRKPPPGVEEVRAWPQRLGLVTQPGHPLSVRTTPLRVRDCLEHPLILMTQDTELRAMTSGIENKERRAAKPMVETSSVAMVRHLVAQGIGVGFLIPENVAQDVLEGRLAWTPFADREAQSHTCIFQRSGQTTPVSTGMFLEFLEAAVNEIHSKFNMDG